MGRGSSVGQSVLRLATSWTVLGSNPCGGEVPPTRSDRPWGPPSLLYNRYRIFPLGVKRPERGVDHPQPSSADVKERVELYLYSPSGPSWTVLWSTSSFYLYLYSSKNLEYVAVLSTAFHVLQCFISPTHNRTGYTSNTYRDP